MSDIIVHGMRMPRTCIECPMQFGGLCFVAPAEVDDTQVAASPWECKGRTEWCPLEDAVKVVRCGDCAWGIPHPVAATVLCGNDGIRRNKRAYCSWGKRRDGGENNDA